MQIYAQTILNATSALRNVAQGELFARPPSNPEAEAARLRFHRRMARQRRRDAVAAYLAEPWSAWAAADEGARVARRFLRRFPDIDRPDQEQWNRSELQAAADYHMEETDWERGVPAGRRW